MSVWGRLKTFHRTALGILIAIGIAYAGVRYCVDPLLAQIAEAKEKLEESEPPDPVPSVETDEEVQKALAKMEGHEAAMNAKKTEMEQIAGTRPKITPLNKDMVLSEFTAMFSKNKLLLLQGGPVPAAGTEVNPPKPVSASSANRSGTPAKKPAVPSKTTAPPKAAAPSKAAAAKTASKNPPEVSTPKEEEPPLKSEKYEYHLEGEFENLFGFLKQSESFEYPARISGIYLGTDAAEEKQTGTGPSSKSVLPSRPASEKTNHKLQLQFHLTLYFHE
ncbi:MAG: hypothetical protein LBQ54_11545 [Planctomycetaceae bacterium]|jgi:hypothetical protein|nr:hypothetical protein [Planctomycetaceae bacterium]